MEEKLKHELMKGETLKWSGCPEQSKLTEAPFNTRLYITWGVAVVVLIVTCALLLPIAVASDVHRVETTVLFLVLNFAPIMLSVQPITDKRRLEKATLYAVTDRRVIVISKDEVMNLPLDETTKFAIENRHDGNGNICINDAIGKKIAKSRTFSVLGVRDSDKNVTGLVFYNVKNPDAVCNFLMRKAV